MTNADDACPICEARISPDAQTCDTCGADLSLLKGGSGAVYVCPECGNELLERGTKCPKCGVEFASDSKTAEEVIFQCPVCGAEVSGDANKCPGCGVEFLSDDDASAAEEIPRAVNSVPAVEPMTAPDLSELETEPRLTTHEAVVAKVEESIDKQPPKAESMAPHEQVTYRSGTLPKEATDADVEKPGTAVGRPANDIAEEIPQRTDEKEKRGLFGLKLGMRRKEKNPEQYTVPSTSIPSSSPQIEKRPPANSAIAVAGLTEKTSPPVNVYATQSEDSEMRLVIQEIRPLLKLAGSVSADITESKQYLDMALENLQGGKLADAGKYARLAKTSIISAIQGHFSEKLEIMRKQIEIEGVGGERKKFLESRITEVSSFVKKGNYDEAQKLTLEFQSEMSAKASQYGEAQELCDELEQLLNCADDIGINYNGSRMIYNEARKHLATGDWSSALLLAKQSKDSLMRSIPAKLSDEMNRAKNEIIDAKISGLQVGDMIAILKQASSTYNEGKYDESLRYISHLRRQFTKLRSP